MNLQRTLKNWGSEELWQTHLFFNTKSHKCFFFFLETSTESRRQYHMFIPSSSSEDELKIHQRKTINVKQIRSYGSLFEGHVRQAHRVNCIYPDMFHILMTVNSNYKSARRKEKSNRWSHLWSHVVALTLYFMESFDNFSTY